MSTLFAMSQVALFGRGLRSTPTTAASATEDNSDSKSSTVGVTAPATSAVEWAMPEPSTSAGQPARWRINSADLEDMMMRAAVGLGFDRNHPSTAADTIDEHHESQQQQGQQQQQQGSPLSQQDLEDDVSSLPVVDPLNGLLPSSRGSSPLYPKAAIGSDYQLEHVLDTTAPSSPCTPSMPLRSLSAVSPTSTRSDELAFQHQLSPQSSRQAAAAAGRVQQTNSGQQGGSTSGRFGLKLLVSNSMAGTLIGKGGTRICEIKDECLADIKVTPNGRFYPGTHERVVLVVGEPGAVQLACDRIVTTIYTAADTSLDITQRVLIPDAASGLIIGHDGGRLGDLRQEAGVASIQVSPRDMCTVAGERVVTLQGPMSAVIYGLSLIVNRMMEDTTASRYQNMSTIYRAVHLHLPPYAVPGGANMHDQPHGHHGGSPPRISHARPSPSYGGPHPHSHDFHSPSTVAGPRGTGREYANNGHGAPGSSWEFGYNNSGGSREFSGHTGAGTPVEYIQQHRDAGSPMHPHHVSTHFGGRHFRHPSSANDFDNLSGGEGEFGRGSGSSGAEIVVDELGRTMSRAREYDSPSHCRREYSPRDGYDQQVRHNNTPTHSRAFSRGYPGDGQVDASAFHPLQQQQQRLRQQQQQLVRASSDFASQDGNTVGSLLPHDSRAAAVAAAAHRSLHDGRVSPNLLASHGHSGMASPPAGGELRRVVVGGGSHGSDTGLAAMFEGINLTSPHGLVGALQPGSSQQLQQQQQSQAQQQAGTSGGGVIVHGELPVPDADVGIILGKGGATVRELQQLSGAKIMIARRNEFMPGTKHRLVTLAGPPMSVNMARYLIMRKIQTEKEKL